MASPTIKARTIPAVFTRKVRPHLGQDVLKVPTWFPQEHSMFDSSDRKVRWLDVAMDHTVAVRVGECLGHILRDLDRFHVGHHIEQE